MSLPMMALPLRGEQILLMLGQAPATAHLAQQYLLGLAWGIAAGAVVHGDPRLHERGQPAGADPVDHAGRDPGQCACWSICCCTARSACRSSACSARGLRPRSSISASFLAGLWFATRRRPFRKYHVLGHFWRIDWQLMRQLIVIGAPISISFLLEYGLFGAAGLLMGLISTTALAAHQIALQVAAILFMVPFGIGMAATVRVGHAIGRGDAGAVRRAGYVATWLGIVLAAVLTLAVIVSRFGIARGFPGREHRRDRRTLRDAAAGRIDLLHRRRHPDRRRRRAARHERHARAAAVCRSSATG